MKRHYFLSMLVLFALLFSACAVAASAFCVEVNVEPVKPVPVLKLAAGEQQTLRYARCPLCADGRVRYSHTTRGEWCTATNNPCAHGDPSVHDRFELREATAIYTCDTCGCTRFQHLEQESRIYCTSKR